jgi:hypothetical protein
VGVDTSELGLVRRGGDIDDTEPADDGCWRWVGGLDGVMGLRESINASRRDLQLASCLRPLDREYQGKMVTVNR